MIMLRSIAALLLVSFWLPVHAQSQPEPLSAGLEGFAYPFEVHYLPLTMEGQPVKMAYMDVAPAGPANGRVALLLHGRNFSGFYWERTIRFLSDAGYRVVIPDQIGFGKSSKPDIALSFHQLARNTKVLLDSLGVERTVVIAHSMGCMLGARFALMYPQQVERLVLESPIGLEDYRLKVPYATNEELAREAEARRRLVDDEEQKRKSEEGGRDEERRHLEELVAKQTKVLEDKLTQLASTMSPKATGVIDPDATHVQAGGAATVGSSSFPGTAGQSFPQFDVSLTPAKKKSLLPLILVLALDCISL